MISKIQGILFLLGLPILIVMSIYYGVNDGNWALFMFLIIGIGVPVLIIIISCEQSKNNYEIASPEERKKMDYEQKKRQEVNARGYAITKESERGGLNKTYYHGSGGRYQLYSALTKEKCYIDRKSDYIRWFLIIRSQYDGHLIEIMVRKYYEDKLADAEIYQKINEMNPYRKFTPKVSSWLLDCHS